MISFKGTQFPKVVILFAVSFVVSCAASYRDPAEIMTERRAGADHAALDRLVAMLAPLVATTARRRKALVTRSLA
ncbi:MAG TPA: hypothetical protein PLI43_07595 [Albidovulum sp.]|uniref:hypothetical protein n=1 Tax=Albidovulum sp. TaxID=1872424 RepID=UPI002C9D0F43|nr:hypothetical protein [Albidovulum sp.]